MESIKLYLSLTYPTIDSLWEFSFGRKFTKARSLFIKLSGISKTELIDGCKTLIREYLETFAMRCFQIKPLRVRLMKLKQMDISDKSFLKEFVRIQSAVNTWNELNIKLGEHRARRFMLKNRANELIADARLHQRCLGLIFNEIEGREDTQFYKAIENILDIVRSEFE